MSDFVVRGFGATTSEAFQDAKRRAVVYMKDDPRPFLQVEEEYEIELHTTRKNAPLVCRLGFDRLHTPGDTP